MPRTKGKGKEKKKQRPDAVGPDLSGLNPLRAGMPSPDSITGVEQMERGGKTYRIIKTDEVDAYEEPPKRRRGRGARPTSRR